MTAQQVIGEINHMPLLDRVQIMEWIAQTIQTDTARQLKIVKSVLTDKEKAIAILKAGCDMSNFGDAVEYQREVRKDRVLPFREEI